MYAKMNNWNDINNNDEDDTIQEKEIRTYIISQGKYKFRNTVHIRCVLVKYDWKSRQISIYVNMYAEKFLEHFSFQLEQFCTRLKSSYNISCIEQAKTETSSTLCLKG